MYCVFIFLAILTHQISAAEIHLYGLFSLSGCDQEDYQCRNAKINADRMIEKYDPSIDDVQQMCVRDMREDVELLYNVLFEIIDNPTTFNMTCLLRKEKIRRETKTTRPRQDRLIFIFTYLSFELTRIVSSMILLPDTKDTVVLSITEQPMYPSYYLDHSYSYYTYQASLGIETHKASNIREFVDQTPIDYCVMLDLLSNNNGNRSSTVSINHGCQKRDSSAFCFYVNQYPKNCFRELHIDIEAESILLKNTIQNLDDEHYNFVVLDGSADLLGRFSAITNVELYLGSPFFIGFVKVINHNKNWDPNQRFSIHRLKSTYRNGNVLLNFPGAILANKFLYYMTSGRRILVHERAIWEGFRDHKQFQGYLRAIGYRPFIGEYDPDFVPGSIMTFDTWSKINESVRWNMVNALLQSKEIYLAALAQGKTRSYIDNVSFKVLQTQDYFDPSPALTGRKMCNDSIQACGKGRYLKHGHFKSENWTRSYGWFCQRCPPGFFKDTIGNDEKCKKCGYPLQVTDDGTRCYDPYILDYLSIDHPFSIFWLVFSGVQFLLILITMAIFIVHRNTPIVLSSIKEMTAIQLAFHLLLTVALPLLFIGRINKEVCYSRPIVIGISLSVLISVMLSKTQKVFLIFKMKVRVTSSEKFITNSIEWFIILITLIIDAVIIIVNSANREGSIDAIFMYDDIRLVKELTCSNNDSLLSQLFFTFFLVFMNCIQGYRARNLPSNYKEVTYVIYSSFISAIVLVSVTVVYFLQSRKYLVREMVIFVAVGILNFVNFALIYFYKVYMILFCPHLNTKKAFNEKKKKKFQGQFN